MLRLIKILSILCLLIVSSTTFAMLSLELTRGVSGAIPITVLPFTTQGQSPTQDIASIITNDLQNSGRFKVSSSSSNNSDDIVQGKIQSLGGDSYQVSFQLLDAFRGKSSPQTAQLLNEKFTISNADARALAHHIADMVYQKITGVRGIFSTRLAYVVVQRGYNGQSSRYILEVADQDGYGPRPLLTSTDPIMSPAWSPNGKQVAYVSFENRHASIYIQDVNSGGRRLVSEFPGINGAPAWSRDGRKLAVVLSKGGSPNIYELDLGSRQLTQLTRDFYINTEPSYSPNGRNVIFTSNRSANHPQIYELNLANHAVSRITYDGSYNARPSYTPDGNHIVVLNRESGMYNIGIMDLDSGTFRVLTNSREDHGSPSIAPNGSMIVYEAYDSGRNVLGMVTTDGQVSLKLPARNGDVQDPAWSPFLS